MSSEVKVLDTTQLIISEEVKPSDKSSGDEKAFLLDEQLTTLEAQVPDSEALTVSDGIVIPKKDLKLEGHDESTLMPDASVPRSGLTTEEEDVSDVGKGSGSITSDPPSAPKAWTEIDKYFNTQVQQVQQTGLEAEAGIPVDSPRQPREKDAGEEFQAGVPAHPYLLKSQQYDGISDENPDISRITDPERRIEVQNELRKKQELQLQRSQEHRQTFNPAPSLGG